jgi:hypothetical protein
MTSIPQVQIALPGLPVVMLCLMNGCIVFIRAPGKMVYSIADAGDEPNFFVLDDCISLWIDGQEPVEIEYQKMYAYKTQPLLLQWLQSLNLQNPFTGEFKDASSNA